MGSGLRTWLSLREVIEKNLFKIGLTGEALFYSLYLVMSRNLFVLYLTSLGFPVTLISGIVFLSTIISTLTSMLIYKYFKFISRISRNEFLLFYVFEKLFFIPIGFSSDPLTIILCYTIVMVSSIFSSLYTNFLIYGLLGEEDIRDITAKRTAVSNIVNILGYILVIFILYSFKDVVKFKILFTLGGLLGSVSIIFLVSIKTESQSILMSVVGEDRKPERTFSITSFFTALLLSSNIFNLAWTPYLMRVLNTPDYLVTIINFAGSLASVFSAILWSKASFKKLRISLFLTSLTPILAVLSPLPILHVGVSFFGSFTFMGANFLGLFLFARQRSLIGIVRISLLLTLITNLSQFLSAILGIMFREDYVVLFMSSLAVRLISILIAYFTITEVAVVPEEYARTFSQILYSNTLLGYTFIIDTVRRSIIVSLKILSISAVLLLLYIVYRFLFFILHVLDVYHIL